MHDNERSINPRYFNPPISRVIRSLEAALTCRHTAVGSSWPVLPSGLSRAVGLSHVGHFSFYHHQNDSEKVCGLVS
jgi:hypothetical protein